MVFKLEIWEISVIEYLIEMFFFKEMQTETKEKYMKRETNK